MHHSVVIERKKDNEETLSCSGFFLSTSCVITQGSLLYDAFDLKNNAIENSCNDDPENLLEKVSDIIRSSTFFVNTNFEQQSEEILMKGNSDDVSGYNSDNEENIKNGFARVKPKWAYFFQDKHLNNDLSNLFGSYSKFKFTDGASVHSERELYFLSSFLIFGWGDCLLRSVLSSITGQCCLVQKGDLIVINSCPFGSVSPEIFGNSLTCGLISNRNASGTLMVTDARCVLGGEGAPVYALKVSNQCVLGLCGIVLSPYCWLNGEWMGITLVATAKSVFEHLLNEFNDMKPIELSLSYEFPKISSMLHLKDRDSQIYPNYVNENITRIHWAVSRKRITKVDCENMINSTVAVVCRSESGSYSWGSGIVIKGNRTVILTCSHVVIKAKHRIVDIIKSNGSRCVGKVVYHTVPLHLAKQLSENRDDNLIVENDFDMWDLAVIVTDMFFSTALPLAENLPFKGSEVFNCGYGLLGPPMHADISASISSGTLCNISYLSARYKDIQGESNFKYIQPNHAISDRFTTVKKDYAVECLPCDSRYQSYKFNSLPKIDDRNYYMVQDSNIGLQRFDENVKRDGHIPVALQTSCPIYGGDSGGPIFAIDSSRGPVVIGIAVCCAKNLKGKGMFPHVNMAVPSCAIVEPIKKYCDTGDVEHLAGLGIKNCGSSKLLWNQTLNSKSKL